MGLNLERRSTLIFIAPLFCTSFSPVSGGSVEQRPVMKWPLNVIIASSSALKRCMHGGDIWKYILLEISDHWKAGEASLPSHM